MYHGCYVVEWQSRTAQKSHHGYAVDSREQALAMLRANREDIMGESYWIAGPWYQGHDGRWIYDGEPEDAPELS